MGNDPSELVTRYSRVARPLPLRSGRAGPVLVCGLGRAAPRQETRHANNVDLAEKVAEAHGLRKPGARKVVDTVFTAIADAAAGGDEMSLSGVGKFKVKASAARECRNPSTGETIKIAASKMLGFSPAKAIKERLNG